MNIIDFIIILLVAFTIIRGFDVGLVRQATSFIGLLVGLLIGSWVVTSFNLSALLTINILAIFVLIGILASEYAGLAAKRALHLTKLHQIDRIGGAILGGAVCLLLVWLSAAIAPVIPSTQLQEDIRDSTIIAWLDRQLPPATDAMRWLEDSVASTKLPELISEFEPALTNPDPSLPDVATFADVTAAAKPSIVEIEGRSCSGIGVGSGFVVAPNTIMTNAHVVAGMRHPFVIDTAGRKEGTVTYFNADLDVALLRVSNLAGKPLPLSDQLVPTGTTGVVLGFPGGEPFAAKPAAIMEQFTALSRDIYNKGGNRRDVYALKSPIQPGNSGGPLVDEQGNVIGMIYARSTVYDQVGYALTSPTLQVLLETANQQPTTASLRCLSE